jgi:hypothetical protein
MAGDSVRLLPPIPDEVPRHLKRADEFLRAGLCVICGKKKESEHVYHCDDCYRRVFASIFDYDDD